MVGVDTASCSLNGAEWSESSLDLKKKWYLLSVFWWAWMNRGSVSRDSHSFETHRKRPTDLAGRWHRMSMMISCGIIFSWTPLYRYTVLGRRSIESTTYIKQSFEKQSQTQNTSKFDTWIFNLINGSQCISSKIFNV